MAAYANLNGDGGSRGAFTPATYWLVSLPLDSRTSKENAWARLNDRTALDAALSNNYKFTLPELRVGTLDSLLQLSDELVKVTASVEGTCTKIRKTLFDIDGEVRCGVLHACEAYVRRLAVAPERTHRSCSHALALLIFDLCVSVLTIYYVLVSLASRNAPRARARTVHPLTAC